jgi:hypothetical protein
VADPARAALLREALDLWRGEPLAGLNGQWAARVREAWRRQRVDAVVGWAHLESRVGDPVPVIGPLTGLLGEYPLVEPLTEALMRALHAAGRGAEALDCYAPSANGWRRNWAPTPVRGCGRCTRRSCGETCPAPPPGRPPGRPPRLPPPLPPATAVGAHRGRPRSPYNCPWAYADSPAATEELARLEAILASAADQPSAVVISAVSGTAGVGKTALAVHWARRAQKAFPDGQLYVNLRGFDPGGSVVSPAEAVRGFLDAFGVPAVPVPPAWRRRPGCTAACWRGGGCWWCSTTPAMPSRSARCCPERPGAWRWSPAGTG